MRAERFLDGTLADTRQKRFSLMRSAWDGAWCVIGHRFENEAAIAEGRLRLAEAVVTVTPEEGANVEHIKRKALDMVSIVERHLRDR